MSYLRLKMSYLRMKMSYLRRKCVIPDEDEDVLPEDEDVLPEDEDVLPEDEVLPGSAVPGCVDENMQVGNRGSVATTREVCYLQIRRHS